MLPTGYLPTSLPLHLPLELTHCVVGDARAPSSEVPFRPRLAYHGLFHIPKVYRTLAATAVPSFPPAAQEGSGPREASAMPTLTKTKQYTTALAAALWQSRDGDIPNLSAFLLGGPEPYGEEQDDECEFVNPFSAASAPTWATNGRGKSLTARDPLLLLEWLEAVNATVNGVGTEGFDPEAMWELKQGDSSATPSSSSSSSCHHFASTTEARAAKDTAKAALDMARKRVLLTRRSWSHFTLSATKGVATVAQILEILGSSAGDVAVAAMGGGYGGSSGDETYYCGNAPATSGIPVALRSAAASEWAVIEAALVVLYNIMHPVSTVEATKVPMIMKTSSQVHHRAEAEGDNDDNANYEPQGAAPPMCLTHVSAGSQGQWKTVRSEISKLRNAPPAPLVPTHKAGHSSAASSFGSSTHRIITVDSFYIKRERSLPTVQKLMKLNIYRPIMALLTRHCAAASAAPSSPDGAAPSPPTSVLSSPHSQIVYYCCLVLSAIGGGTKVCEDGLVSARLTKSIRMLPLFGGTKAVTGSEPGGGDEGSDSEGEDEGDDEDGKKGKKSKSKSDAEAFNGGTSSGPLKLAGVAGLAKTATIARLGGGAAALMTMAGLVTSAITNQMAMGTFGGPRSSEVVSRAHHHWPRYFGSSWVVFGHQQSSVAPLTFLSALFSALCTMAAGPANITFLHKRGALDVVGSVLEALAMPMSVRAQQNIPCSSTDFGSLQRLQQKACCLRWALEFLYRSLNPSPSRIGGGVMNVQLPPEELTLLKDIFIKDHRGIPALMATAAIGALGAGDTGTGIVKVLPFPSSPLFCASCDVLHLVLSVPTVTAMARSVDGGLNPLVACVAESAAADSRLAALLASASLTTLQVAACYRVLRPSPASWALLILFLQRALDIKELPVGTDNELAWFPPPELVEQLKKQQLLAAENSSKQAEGEGEGEEEEENDQANDEDDEEVEEDGDFVDDDIAAAAMGLGDYSPELQYRSLASDQAPSASAAPLIPSHTSILGIASVHHIKPFSADRPVPSSTAVINNSPSAIEPLLLQAETRRSEVVKGQLRRLLFGPEFVKSARVAFDDLARAEQMPKTRLSSILGEAPKGVGCDFNSNSGPAPTWAEPPRTITARLALDAASAPLPSLSFDSSFESGNLKRAIHVMDNEYDLILHTDVNTNSFVQWFYFSVKGMVPNTKYRFNILNMEKESSTFNDGQRPLLFSEKRFEQSSKRVAWVREGEDIAYYKNSLARRVRERYVPLELMAISGKKGKGDTDELLNEESATGKKGQSQKGASSKATTPKSPAPVAKGKGLSIGSKRRSESGSGVSSQQTQGAKVPAKDPKPKKVKKAASNTSTYYTLSFTITFPHANDRVYLSNCYPYTYSDLVGYCRRLITGHEEACAAKGQSQQADKAKAPQVPPHCLFVQSLCPTLSGNATPLLTITNLRRKDGVTIVPEEDLRRRPVVLLTARVHPGESNASYMIKGCADFLLSPTNIVAAQLRDQFVFKIIPMLNPDGVINGNHRCGLAGTDLNRGYHKPSRWRNPTIFYLKALVYHIKRIEGRSVLLYSDFHGHSRCHNSVIYGCGEENTMKSIFEGLAIAANSPTMPTSPLFGAEVGSSFSQASEPTQGGASTSKKKTGKKTAETVAESFGFSESSKPHPFTLPYNTNLSMSYGPPERLLPLLLSQLCPYFSFGSSTFTVQKGKRNTGRVVFYRQMGIRMSYTIEASMMGGFGCDFAMSSAATCDEFPSRIICHQNHHQDTTMAIAAYAISKSPMDADAFKRLSAEQQQRLAAQWAIQHDQLSGLQRPDPTGVGASDGKPPTSAAGHFSPKHYCTIGIMFLKALHFMYSYSNPQLGMTPKVPQHGNEDDPYYGNREAEDGKTPTSNLPIEPQIAAAVDGLPPSIGTSMAVLRRAALEAADKRRKARAVKKTKTKKPKGASAAKSKGNAATSTGPGGAKLSNPRTPSTASEVQPQSAKALPPKAGKVSNTTSPQIGPMSAGVISFDSSARAQRSSAPPQKPVAGGSRVPGIRSGSGGALYSSGQRGLGASPAISQGKKVVAGGLPPQRPATQQATMSGKHVDLHGGTPLALIARTSPSPSPPPPMVFSGTYANATRKGSMVPSSVRDDGEGQFAGLGGIEEKERRSEYHQYPEEDDTASDSADENIEEEEDEEEEDIADNMPDPEDDEYDLGDECPAPLDCPAQALDSATGKPSLSTTAPKPPQPKAKNRAKPLQHPAPLDILGFCRQAFAQGPVLI